ncbi:MAG: aldo/keto reductase [Sinobacteraceae bacterium]|nr:aldo/keto reductase [Nevskiaceae bacterium]
MTRLGFGAAPIGNLYAEVDDGEALSAVRVAWDRGIRYFDTAPYYGYGLSEERLGRALEGLARNSFVLSTKVGRRIYRDRAGAGHHLTEGFAVSNGRAEFDYSREGIRLSVEESLQRLRTDYIDILLLHDVGAMTHGARHAELIRQALDESLPVMAELKGRGVCRAIGIGVNEEAVCLELLPQFPLDYIMLAGRYTLIEQAGGLALLTAARQRSVGILVAGPYNSGLLSGALQPGNTYNYAPVEVTMYRRAEQLYAICGQLGVDVGAAALQFPLAHPAVASVVAGMRSAAEVESAVARLKAKIPTPLWQQLRAAGFVLPEAPTP